MKMLLNILDAVPEFTRLAANLESGRSPVEVAGLSPVHRAHFAAGLLERLDCPVVLVCADELKNLESLGVSTPREGAGLRQPTFCLCRK